VHLLLHHGAVSKMQARGASGSIRRQPLRLALLGFLIEVELQLVAEFFFAAIAVDPPSKLAEERHGSSPVKCSTSPIARVKACHFDCSATSCLRPNAVNR